jgi:hypothetical protein
MSLIVAFFGSEGYLGNARILVPEVKSLTEFSYPVQFERMLKSSCSQVRVFYLDRTAECTPHDILFFTPPSFERLIP